MNGFCFKRCTSTALSVVLFGILVLLVATGMSKAIVGSRDIPEPTIALNDPHVVVLKSKRVMHLFDGEVLVRTYAIDLGRSPVGRKHLEGDGRTPEGTFYIATKNRKSRFHLFLGLSYPDIDAAEWGYTKGFISEGEARGICEAIEAGHRPNWQTALGGAIGIHGHGGQGKDWTAGCVAVTNGQVEELFAVLRVGDRVEILP